MASGTLAPEFRRNYILGGDATVTIVSKRSGDRFTYNIKRARARDGQDEASLPFFVSVLTGPNNREDYEFLGTIFADGRYRRSAKSKVSASAPSAVAWAWTWEHLEGALADRVEVWHEGRCSRCGRPLTDPESIERGLGPICAERAMGG